jgi:hypothetical protein
MADLYAMARRAAATEETEAERAALKTAVGRLVGYPCKIACQAQGAEDGSMEWVEIYVFSERRGRVTDYLELQPSGAFGVIFDLYDDPEKPAVGDLSDRCDAYNEEKGLEFTEHDELAEDILEGSGDEAEGSDSDSESD